MKVEDHIDGATNFISWSLEFSSWKKMSLSMRRFQNQTLKKTNLIRDLLKLVNEKVSEPEAEEDKSH